MLEIGKGCDEETILCVGGGEINQDVIRVLGCGSCNFIIKEKPLNAPSYMVGVYWHNSPTYSFGFSGSWQINQGPTDDQEPTDELRLSWNIDNNKGGYRAGAYGTTGTDYTKYFFMKYGFTSGC